MLAVSVERVVVVEVAVESAAAVLVVEDAAVVSVVVAVVATACEAGAKTTTVRVALPISPFWSMTIY